MVESQLRPGGFAAHRRAQTQSVSEALIRPVRTWIWIYFWFLIFEGALRKWLVPSLQAPLLIVRDPIVFVIYLLALRARVFPRNGFVVAILSLAALAGFAGIVAIPESPQVVLYGLRTNFLHLPLIFVMPKVFDREQIRRFGKWMMILAIPMVILMVFQFQAPRDAFINAGAGGAAGQLDMGGGRIRAAGTFSFVTGVAAFFPLLAAFLFDSQFERKRYPAILSLIAWGCLVLGTAVSGSRALLGGVFLVTLFAFFGAAFVYRRKIGRFAVALLVLAVAYMGASQFSVFAEGADAFGSRIENAGKSEGGAEGFVERFVNDGVGSLDRLGDAPVLGVGLGMGTNAAAAMTVGTRKFLLAEREWERNILESGPLIGLAYIVLRLALTLSIGAAAFRSARRGNLLPLLLFAIVGLWTSGAQLGPPTTLGFMVFGGGLCLAAAVPNKSDAAASPASRKVAA